MGEAGWARSHGSSKVVTGLDWPMNSWRKHDENEGYELEFFLATFCCYFLNAQLYCDKLEFNFLQLSVWLCVHSKAITSMLKTSP